jgi:hypothetical protein
MIYCMSCRADAWVQPETGVPERRQVVNVVLDDGTQLVAVIVHGLMAWRRAWPTRGLSKPMSRARWAGKGQTMRWLRPQEVDLVELGGMRVSVIILLPHHAHTIHWALVGIQ